jgi:3-hydroxymyristoyl/3-hydroxydecanoyl-(acyl carrier protein) dehydratase
VLIAEALAQMAGLVGANGASSGRLAQVDVRFTQSVAPPAEIVLRARLAKSLGQLSMFDVLAVCNGATVAEGSVTLAFSSPQAGHKP